MRIVYDPNAFDLADGRFAAVFLGCSEFHNPNARGKDGAPIGPGIKWAFRFIDGPNAGKEGAKITTQIPTHKNACGRMICAIGDSDLSEATAFDSDAFTGCYYAITVRDGRVDDTPPPRFVGSGKMKPEDAVAVVTGKRPAGEKPAARNQDDPIPF